MSEKVLDVMKKHLESAEKYIEALDNASSVADCVAAMKQCSSEVKSQYQDLQDISEEYNKLMLTRKANDELKTVSEKTGDCFGRKSVEMMPKIAVYMADADFITAQKELDDVLINNPLFNGLVPDDSALLDVANSLASTMHSMSEKMHVESEGVKENDIAELERILSEFDASAKRFNKNLSKSNTARKAVESCDIFVDSVKKLLPAMNTVAGSMRLLMAKGELPENVSDISKSLKETLSKELSEIIKEKQDIMQEQKVQKSVKKLGELLESMPF